MPASADLVVGSSAVKVVLAQELATYYAWLGDGEQTLKFVRLAFERSPVGIDQRLVQSGLFDKVRKTPGFERELRQLQEATWPRVLEQRQRLDAPDATVPFAAYLFTTPRLAIVPPFGIVGSALM